MRHHDKLKLITLAQASDTAGFRFFFSDSFTTRSVTEMCSRGLFSSVRVCCN